MRQVTIAVCAILLCAAILPVRDARASVCGNGVVEQNEECDPGGGLYRLGNPGSTPCDGGGGDGVPGSECFFQFTCCKFNCQFANPGPCFDGNDCTVFDACNNTGSCNQGTPAASSTACGDPSATECDHADTCDGAGACVSNVQPAGAPCGGPPPAGECGSDDLCNGAGSCVAQTVPAGTPAPTQCNDGNVCTADECDGAGGCQHPGVPAGTACGSGSSTQCDLPDSCNGSGTCLTNHKANATPCNDGLFCTTTDSCQGGVCTGSGSPCAGNPLCQNVCNEVTHGCIAPAGTSCDDGNACDGVATCNGAGTCLPGTPPSDGSPCEDGNPCTVLDTCAGEVCDSGPAFVGERKAKLANDAVAHADIACWGSPGTIALGKGAFMSDGTSLTATKVKLALGASAFDVAADTIRTAFSATIRGTTSPAPPSTGPFCTIPTFTCGGSDLILTNLEPTTITPGSYGNIVLIDGAVLALEPGHYTICSLSAGRATSVTFKAGGPSTLDVVGTVRVSNGSFFGVEEGAPWPLVRVAGKLAIFGRDGETVAHIVAPTAKIRVGVDGHYNGTMCGRDLKGAWRVDWSCSDTAP